MIKEFNFKAEVVHIFCEWVKSYFFLNLYYPR